MTLNALTGLLEQLLAVLRALLTVLAMPTQKALRSRIRNALHTLIRPLLEDAELAAMALDTAWLLLRTLLG